MKELIHKTSISVRFSEVDSLQIVWHGNYVKYFEDGREAFGKIHDLGYLQVYRQGFSMPIVNLECNYKSIIKYEDEIEIETRYVDSPAAKLIFDYRITNNTTGQLAATGRSVQVFLTKDGELQLTIPPFFEKWKQKWLKG